MYDSYIQRHVKTLYCTTNKHLRSVIYRS